MRRFAFRVPACALVAAVCSIDTVTSRVTPITAPTMWARARSILYALESFVLVGLLLGFSLSSSAQAAPASSPLVADAQTVTAEYNTPTAFVLTGSDSTPGGPYTLTFTIQTSPTQGTLSGTAPNLVYTPTGLPSSTDSFTFFVSDTNGASTLATVTLNVVPALPVANPTFANVLFDSSANFVLSGSDSNP